MPPPGGGGNLLKWSEIMSKRAAIYARVSYDDRDNQGLNLAGQLEMGREYCAQKGYKVVEELAEDERGASGVKIDLPKLTRVFDLAGERAFDVLIVREIDRLSRDLAKQLVVEKELKRQGVRIEYVLYDHPDTPEGRYMKHSQAVNAEYQREDVIRRLARGKRNKIKVGSVSIGSPPYGYDRIQRDKRYSLEIYEPEAEIVRLVYSWYVDGDQDGESMTIRGIARKLSELGIPTRKDTGRQRGGYKLRGKGKWAAGTVGEMLKNETYRGVWWWNKGREDSLSIDVPAIIDDDIWKQAQQRARRNKKLLGKRVNEYLLTSHVQCGLCGSNMMGRCVNLKGYKKYLYYVCQASRKDEIANKICDMPAFRVDVYDALVWDYFVELLSDPAKLQAGLDDYKMSQENHNSPLQERLAAVDELLEEYRKKLARLLDLYLGGDFEKDMLVDHKKRLDDTIHGLENEREVVAGDHRAPDIDARANRYYPGVCGECAPWL